MKVSRWVMLAAVALLAVGLAAGGALVRSDSGDGGATEQRSRPRSSATSASSTTGRSTSRSSKGLKRAKAKLGVSDPPAAVELGERLHPEPHVRRSGGTRTSSSPRASCSANDDGDGGEEVPEHELRDHRLHGARGAVRGQEGQAAVHERRGPDVRGERGRLPRRRARGQDGAEGRQEGHRRRRRPQDPAGRHLDRRLPATARGKAVPGTKVLDRLLAGLRRGRQVQDASPRTRSRRARRCSSRSPAAAASAR